MSINIRRIENSEIVLVKKITKKTAWENFSEDQKRALDRDKWGKHMDELFDKIFKKDSHEIFVAENGNHSFLGYVWVGEGTGMMTGTKHGYIWDIFVKKNYRRKGIGTTLMKRAEKYCREKGYTKMMLMVTSSNQQAIKLYTKQGFEAEQMYMAKKLSP